MKIPTDLSDNICPKAPRWRHLLKQSAMRLHTNLTTDPELVWAFKLRRNVLLDIIADRCTSNLILSSWLPQMLLFYGKTKLSLGANCLC